MIGRKKILIATHNKGKFNRFKIYLTQLDPKLEIVSLADLGITLDVEETGKTYEENARLKAEAYAKLSGLLTLADDGGIEIDALNGQPGIYSSRYAGENKTDAQKVDFILDKLKEVPVGKRQARFVVILALAKPDEKVKFYKGKLPGTIAKEPRGIARNQLPYRQIFIPEGYEQTLDELDDAGVSYTSHRKKAIEKLIRELN